MTSYSKPSVLESLPAISILSLKFENFLTAVCVSAAHTAAGHIEESPA